MKDFRSLIIGFALVGLFALAIFSFGYGLQVSNDINKTILDDQSISVLNSSVSSSLRNFSNTESGDAAVYWNATVEEQAEEQIPVGDLTVGSIWHSISTFGSFIFGMGGVMFKLLYRVGVSPIVLGVLFAILIVVAILVSWRLIKLGS